MYFSHVIHFTFPYLKKICNFISKQLGAELWDWSCRLWLPAVAPFITLGEGLLSQVVRTRMQETGVPVPGKIHTKKTLPLSFLMCLCLCTSVKKNKSVSTNTITEILLLKQKVQLFVAPSLTSSGFWQTRCVLSRRLNTLSTETQIFLFHFFGSQFNNCLKLHYLRWKCKYCQ